MDEETEAEMKRKTFTPEQIIGKLRAAEVLFSQGQTVGAVSRKLEVTEQTYYRWRKECGGMQVNSLFTPKEVQKLLKCSLPWIYKVSSNGMLPCVRISCPGLGARKKEMVRFKQQDVWDFIERHYRR
jgi:putative transposase